MCENITVFVVAWTDGAKDVLAGFEPDPRSHTGTAGRWSGQSVGSIRPEMCGSYGIALPSRKVVGS